MKKNKYNDIASSNNKDNNDFMKNKRDIFPKYIALNSLTNVPKSSNIDYKVYVQNHLNDQKKNFFLDIQY
jgi:hypothetical protein